MRSKFFEAAEIVISLVDDICGEAAFEVGVRPEDVCVSGELMSPIGSTAKVAEMTEVKY